MRSNWCSPRSHRPRTIDMRRPGFRALLAWGTLCTAVPLGSALAADAPAWMRAQIAAPVPAHNEKTDAVLLYSETIFTVLPNGKMKRLVREAYKILRPEGESRGLVRVDFSDQTRLLNLQAWCIPVAGKDYEVKDRDAVVSSLVGAENGELVSDVRTKLLQIPAAVPGSIVGYEVEQEQRPYDLSDEWEVQDSVPVRAISYTLQLPPGWAYRSVWINHADMAPSSAGSGQWHWSLGDLAAINLEPNMPPWHGMAGRMIVKLIPPNAQARADQGWRDIGLWYLDLCRGRRDASAAIKQKVADLTAGAPTLLAKMRALASFVQSDIRYVAIELGIGGQQPHAAADVFTHRYGDCKDKATLLSAMLKEIGVDSFYVIINSKRGSITAETPPNLDFDHAILAIQLPESVTDVSLQALLPDPKLGRLLFFDPTDPFVPFGGLSGELQANYGLLVTADGGGLVQLPQLPADANALRRTASLTLDDDGTLRGDVAEVRVGARAAEQRYALRSSTQDTDRIKPVEAVAANAFGTYRIVKASVGNLRVNDMPFLWNYSIEVEGYARTAGDLLLVRPRVLGSKALGFLETKEPREHPIEFDGPEHDSDVFEIALPADYVVDNLPPPVNADYGFASYQSKTEVIGHTLRYTRSFEIRKLDVPASNAEQLKQLYRTISGDERMTAVLKRASASP